LLSTGTRNRMAAPVTQTTPIAVSSYVFDQIIELHLFQSSLKHNRFVTYQNKKWKK
jgi:hypothetical protein